MWYPLYAEVDVVKIGHLHSMRAKPWEEAPSDATTQCRDLTIPCFKRQNRFTPMVDFMKKWGIQSGCVLPLTKVHRRLGVLLLGSDEAEGDSQTDICFLALAA